METSCKLLSDRHHKKINKCENNKTNKTKTLIHFLRSVSFVINNEMRVVELEFCLLCSLIFVFVLLKGCGSDSKDASL